MLLTEIWDFQILLTSEGLHDVSSSALNLVQLIQLGKLEQGAITTLSKFKSRNESWFNQSKTKTTVLTTRRVTLFAKKLSTYSGIVSFRFVASRDKLSQ